MNLSLKRPSPVGFLFIAIFSIQFGSALAKSLFNDIGPWGVVGLRVGFSALFLFAIWRPKFHSKVKEHIGLIVLFGVVMATMNSAFYAAIDRIPLGIAISIEFTGPLGLSILKSQHWRDGLWAAIAIAGILLLTPISGASLDIWGMLLALFAGLCWAMYIVLAAKLGPALPGVEGLAWGLVVGTILLLPIGIATAGSALLSPRILLLSAGVGLLSTALPYACEIVALRSLPVKVFGVMLSMEPMVGVLAGFLILGEKLSVRSLIACVLVSIAAAGAARYGISQESNHTPTPPPAA
ncbi:MAG: EamA family transporter [Cyanobacteria bacterium J06560_6]